MGKSRESNVIPMVDNNNALTVILWIHAHTGTEVPTRGMALAVVHPEQILMHMVKINLILNVTDQDVLVTAINAKVYDTNGLHLVDRHLFFHSSLL
jgi:hypothetical protein